MFPIVGCSTTEIHQNESASEQVIVLRVVDGDTIEVQMKDGSQERVRFIGIDAPETNGGNAPDCYAQESADFLRGEIDKSTITLIPQPTDNRDKYKRLLRYVHTPTDDVGLKMIDLGLATSYPWFNHPRKGEYKYAEDEAKRKNKGLWGECE